MTAGQAVGVGGVITPSQYQGGGGGGAVSSVFGRAGAVVATTGDYTAAQVGADPAGAATTAQANAEAFTSAGFAPIANAALTGTPTSPTAAPGDTSTQIATDAFVAAAVNAAVQGLAVKPSVQEATTTALPANTYSNGASGVGATLTAVLPGVLTVDGIAVTLGSRVLVQDEAAAANNGIYVMTTLGTVSVAYVLTRAGDMNQAAEVPGAFVFTEQGTVNAGAGFTVSGAGPYTIGTTAINWTQFSGAGEITAGAGLTKTGNVLSLGVLTTAGDLLYENATPAPARLAVGTAAGPAGDFLGISGGVPAWQQVSGQYLCPPTQYAPASQTTLTVTGTTMAAFSSANVNTGTFTAPPSGSVIVTASFCLKSLSPGTVIGLALAAHGTTSPLLSNVITWGDNVSQLRLCTAVFLVTGLTSGTNYNLDLMGGCGTSGDSVDIIAIGQVSTTIPSQVQGPVIMTVQAV
jgi:hypothetical protein